METLSPEQIEQLQQANEALQRQLASQHMWSTIYGWSILVLFVLFVIAVGVAYWLWRKSGTLQEKLSSSVSNHQRTHTAYTQKEAEYNSLSLEFGSVRQERDEHSATIHRLRDAYQSVLLEGILTGGKKWELQRLGGKNWVSITRDPSGQIFSVEPVTPEQMGIMRMRGMLTNLLGHEVTEADFGELQAAGWGFDHTKIREELQVPAANRRPNPPPRRVIASPSPTPLAQQPSNSEWTRFTRALGGVPAQPPGEPTAEDVLEVSPPAQPVDPDQGL